MSEAFSNVSDFVLYIDDTRVALPELFQLYGVRKPFEIKVLKFTKNKPRAFCAALAYRTVIKENPAETIFYVREGLLAFFLILMSRRFRNNFFYEMHSFVRHSKFIYKTIFYFAHGIISTSESKAEVLVDSFKVSRDHILVAPNVLDPADFENMPSRDNARKVLGISNDKPVVMFTGKPEALRGIDLILELAGRMGGKVAFICVGGTQEEIDALQNRSGFEKVRFVPFVPHRDVVHYMAAADILIAPQSARPEFEKVSKYSSPLKILEYMATGIPAIFSRIPAIEKIVGVDDNFFAKSDSVEDWVRKIENTMEQYIEVQKKTAVLRTRALENTWQNRAKAVLDFIHD